MGEVETAAVPDARSPAAAPISLALEAASAAGRAPQTLRKPNTQARGRPPALTRSRQSPRSTRRPRSHLTGAAPWDARLRVPSPRLALSPSRDGAARTTSAFARPPASCPRCDGAARVSIVAAWPLSQRTQAAGPSLEQEESRPPARGRPLVAARPSPLEPTPSPGVICEPMLFLGSRPAQPATRQRNATQARAGEVVQHSISRYASCCMVPLDRRQCGLTRARVLESCAC